MKKNFRAVRRHFTAIMPACLSVFLLCTSLFSFSQGDIWQQKQSLGMPVTSRSQAVSFSIGGKGYVGGGTNAIPFAGASLSDLWEFDPATNVWTQKADLPGGPRYLATGFSIGNKGYMGNKDFWEYDPATNVWTRKADFGGAGISGATGFSIGTKGYIGTGLNTLSQSTNDFWEFDPTTNVWTQKANFGGAVRSAASGFSIGNKGYIGLGSTDPRGIGVLFSDFWEYDPAANTWVQRANFGGEARWGATGFSVGNKGFLGIGIGRSLHSLNDFWEYDPATNVWTQRVNFGGAARELAVGFSIGNKGYIGTGYRDINQSINGPTTDFWEYDTVLNNWTQKADLGGGPRQYAVGFGIAGKGYVGTGYDGSPKKDFWEYDTATGLWMQKADFAGGERREATGFGIGNKGYVGQGYIHGRPDFKNDLWQYDPVTNAWTLGTGPGSVTARAQATAFRIGGKEYFGMGYFVNTLFSDFWEFDPTTGAWTQKADFAGTPGGSGAGFGIGSKGYAVGADIWQYDPAANAWTQKANAGAGDPFAYAFSSSSKGYALTINNALWEYDPAGDTWTNRASFPGPARQGATAFSIGNNGYFGFGSTSAGLKNDFWQYIPSSVNSSITTTVAPETFCSRSTITVSFIATGAFNAGNIFAAELSDSSGGFAMPKVIGRDTSTVSGVMHIVVPDSLKSGRAYRIRVVSSSPAITGTNNGVNLVINPSPVITDASAIPNTLWPPNHKLRSVTVNYQVSDNCGVASRSLSVTSNGPQADSQPDWIILDDHHVLLRAEKNKSGSSERIYSITITVRDSAGNAAKAVVTVVVAPPGSMGDRVERVEDNANDAVIHNGAGLQLNGLTVSARPNPAHQNFTLIFGSNSDQPIIMRVIDNVGRPMETRANVAPNGVLQIGDGYSPGNYYVQVIQGEDQVTLHLVKLPK